MSVSLIQERKSKTPPKDLKNKTAIIPAIQTPSPTQSNNPNDTIYNFELKLKKIAIEYKNSFTFKLYWKTKSNLISLIL